MKKLFAVPAVLWCAVLALGQGGPAPCTSKIPDGVPCFDANFGVVVRFSPPNPTEKLPSLPPPSPPVILPEGLAPKHTEPAVSDDSEYWSYKPDGKCDYHDGANVQSFNESSLENYASNEEKFDASYQVGGAIGDVIGALINTWVRHHQRMVILKRENLQQQFIAYDDANLDMKRHVMQNADIMATDFALLTQLDPAEKDTWEEGVRKVPQLKADIEAQVIADEKMRPQILASVKHLQSNVAIAKQSYDQHLKWVEKADVWTRIVGGVVGYYEHQQQAHQVTPTEGRP